MRTRAMSTMEQNFAASSCGRRPERLLHHPGRSPGCMRPWIGVRGAPFSRGQAVEAIRTSPFRPERAAPWKNFHISPAKGLDLWESVLQWRQREGGFRGRLFAFLRREAMAGAEKSPGGNERERCVRRLARAIRCANRAGADRRADGRGRACRIRAQKGSAAWGRPGRRDADRKGVESNGTRRRSDMQEQNRRASAAA